MAGDSLVLFSCLKWTKRRSYGYDETLAAHSLSGYRNDRTTALGRVKRSEDMYCLGEEYGRMCRRPCCRFHHPRNHGHGCMYGGDDVLRGKFGEKVGRERTYHGSNEAKRRWVRPDCLSVDA